MLLNHFTVYFTSALPFHVSLFTFWLAIKYRDNFWKKKNSLLVKSPLSLSRLIPVREASRKISLLFPNKNISRRLEMKVLQESASNRQNNTPEAYGVDSGLLSLTSNNNKKVTHRDIEVVQNLVERCLQLYMNKNEVVDTLLRQARIEPEFTSLVWHKLEEENAEFFRGYYLRLVLRKQINVFNRLLEHQYHLMKYSAPSQASLPPIQRGNQHLPVDNLHMGYTNLQQLSMPPTGQPQINLMSGVSSYHMLNGISATGNFHSTQMHSGILMNSNTAGTVSGRPFIKPEMDMSPASGASNSQYPFTPTEISELSRESSAIESTFTSHNASTERLQLGSDCGIVNSEESPQLDPLKFQFSNPAAVSVNLEDGQLASYSTTDVLLDSPEQNVEEFFADGVPAQDS